MEELIKIARSILSQRELEDQRSISNLALGRFDTKFNNIDCLFWLTNRENTGQNRAIRNINGDIVGFQQGPQTTLAIEGRSVYKNTKVGEILILNQPGIHEVNAPGGIQQVEVLSGASYRPVNVNEGYAADLIIKLNTEDKINVFQSLNRILELDDSIIEDTDRLNVNFDEEAEAILRRIEERKLELDTYLNKAHSFIRRSAELRYQPILDHTQERVKRSMVFDGVLIINGGPGTGKTTSLIQRIQFLISNSINEYYDLSQRQKDVLFGKNNWLFYSPSELLALYLKNSMLAEGLKSESDSVRVWSDDKNELVKAYKLVDTETKRPFLIYNKYKETSIWKNDSESIKRLISDFNVFFISYLQHKIEKIQELEISKFSWSKEGISIQKFLERKKVSNLRDAIRLYLNLNETYRGDAEKISKAYSDKIKYLLGNVIVTVLSNEELVSNLTSLFKSWKSNFNQDSEDSPEELDLNDMEEEDFEEKAIDEIIDFEIELFNKLKTLIRKLSIKRFDKSIKLNAKDKILLDYFPALQEDERLSEIGELAFFKKHFDKILKGVVANVVRELPVVYKKYRLHASNIQDESWDLKILMDIIKDKNIRLHVDEQAFLLYFVNNLCLLVKSEFASAVKDNNHPYFIAYEANVRPVIAVDEASDFSIIDILAMHSFGHPEISSFTLSGDIMQRLTDQGISSWDGLKDLLPKLEICDLKISYRQSQTLIALAKAIYQKSVGSEAPYSAFLEKDESEPMPLLYCNERHDEKLHWLSQRIIEIYRAYGNSIPSIAVFLSNENLLEEFAKQLRNIDGLADVGIRVVACRDGNVLGDKNTIRVFSIDKIKGLEFEAVFFYDIDKLFIEAISKDLLLKYLYVGLSRATFYLGVTLSNNLPEEFEDILHHFSFNSGDWRAIKRA